MYGVELDGKHYLTFHFDTFPNGKHTFKYEDNGVVTEVQPIKVYRDVGNAYFLLPGPDKRTWTGKETIVIHYEELDSPFLGGKRDIKYTYYFTKFADLFPAQY